MNDDAPYGPFTPGLEPVERAARCRSFAQAAHCRARNTIKLVEVLREAETSDAAMAEARAMFERLPSVARRHILTSFSVVQQAGRKAKEPA